MRIEYRVCDRCGARVEYEGPHAQFNKRFSFKRVRFVHEWGGFGVATEEFIDIEHKFEFCADCFAAVMAFCKTPVAPASSGSWEKEP